MPLSLFHLHGDLKDLRVPRLLAALREDDFTGVFQASVRTEGSENDITREVHFLEGLIAWAISTDPEESLRAYLVRNGAITDAQWSQAEDKARETTLRQALVELGLVGSNELTQIERGRAEEIVLALFSADQGEYRVRERQLSPGTPHLKIDPRGLILKGVLEGGDRALILEEIGSLDTVYVVKRPVLEEPGLSLPGEFQSVLRLIDGKRSIAQICSLTTMPDYFVCSVFAALSMVGAVRGSHARSQTPRRPVIVKGADVVSPSPAAGAAPAEPPPDSPDTDPEPSPDASHEPASGAPPEPPIATAPFRGEGPVTLLDAVEETEAEDNEAPLEDAPPQPIPESPRLEDARPSPEAGRVRAREDVAGGREAAPPRQETFAEPAMDRPRIRKEPLDPVPRIMPSIARSTTSPPPAARQEPLEGWRPDPPGHDELPGQRSRPWFLLGGALAVAGAALFLILMAQGSGDAVEEIRLPADPTLRQEARPAERDAGDEADEPDAAEDHDESRPAAAAASPRSSTSAPGSLIPPAAPQNSSPERVATPPASRMLETSADELGRRMMLAGNYREAARHFGREVTGGSGSYSIQLLLACQDDTVRRAVESGRSSPEMFILSTTFQGRSCYRLYWGRYPTQKRAQEALLRDIPSAFRRERPRVTRLAGS